MLELRRGFGAGHGHRAGARRGPAARRGRQRPRRTSAARSTPTRADKAARFLQLCDAFDLPVLFLCDTPGFMVGPDAERTATVRHFARMFVDRREPVACRSARSCCARATGSARRRWPAAASRRRCSRVAWPTVEFGAMGLEGAVRLGMRRELEAIEDAGRARAGVRADGRRRLRARARAQHGRLRRDRRRDRPGRLAPLDRHAVRRRRRAEWWQRRRQDAARTSTPGSRRPRRTPRASPAPAPRPAPSERRSGGIIRARPSPGTPGMDPKTNRTDIFSRAGIRRGTGPKPMSHRHPTPRPAHEDRAHRRGAARRARARARREGRADRPRADDGRPARRPPLADPPRAPRSATWSSSRCSSTRRSSTSAPTSSATRATSADDAELAAQAGADVLFAPSVEEVYPAGFATTRRSARPDRAAGGRRARRRALPRRQHRRRRSCSAWRCPTSPTSARRTPSSWS